MDQTMIDRTALTNTDTDTDTDTVELVRLSVYQRFATTGRTSSPAEVARRVGITEESARHAFDSLESERHIVRNDSGEIVLAHPFATTNFGFSVMGDGVLWWGGCAWDAFAIPHLVDSEPTVLVATTCPACSTPHAWNVGRDVPPEGTQLAHFLTPMADVWSDVVHACAHQQIFCGDDCIELWLEQSNHNRGSVFDLTTLWRLASRWYEGRLAPGYRRREPIEAADYFASAGLRGAFWGND